MDNHVEDTKQLGVIEEFKNVNIKKRTMPVKSKESFLSNIKKEYDEFKNVHSAPMKFKGKYVRGNLVKDFNNQPKQLKCEFCDKEVDKLIFNSHLETHPSKILDWIYLGSYNNALNKEELQKVNIKYILNCANECKNLFAEDFIYKKLLMTDSPSTKIVDHLEEAFEFIETAKKNNAKILVHCQLGKSRSSSILIAYFVKYLGYDCDSAYTFLKNKRKIVFPNLSFMRELKDFSKTVHGNPKRTSSTGKNEKI